MEVEPLDPQVAENRELLELLMAETTGAVTKGDAPRFERVVSEGDAESPPMVAKVHQDSGNVLIYDIKTGEPSVTSRNMLPAQLRKKNTEGERMFSIYPPAQPPKRGTIKCHLHPDVRHDHPEYDEWGLGTCTQDHLINSLQLQLHMQHRHKSEWEAIKAHEKEVKEQGEIDRQERLILAASGNAPPKHKAG